MAKFKCRNSPIFVTILIQFQYWNRKVTEVDCIIQVILPKCWNIDIAGSIVIYRCATCLPIEGVGQSHFKQQFIYRYFSFRHFFYYIAHTVVDAITLDILFLIMQIISISFLRYIVQFQSLKIHKSS